ncbi:hypothetical protein FDO65_10120 [Nakamurella flava]|uniref:Uncharacterized protein n=1 Tax=Nakamurella flava TaxID=2576308 RepID=A0A4U6QMJ8_9ACTN|nr:hypothetical protein [Nakamurella flava]TKV61870.1 hypothetical protein FDO65_10120 [Nakamurella flava]
MEIDVHAIYGFDVAGPGRDDRSGPWLRKRVENLPFHPNSVAAARVRADIQVARERREKAEKAAKTERG